MNAKDNKCPRCDASLFNDTLLAWNSGYPSPLRPEPPNYIDCRYKWKDIKRYYPKDYSPGKYCNECYYFVLPSDSKEIKQ